MTRYPRAGAAAAHSVKLVNYPWKRLDKAARRKAVSEILKLRRPVVAHAFLSKAPEYAEFEYYFSEAAGRQVSRGGPLS